MEPAAPALPTPPRLGLFATSMLVMGGIVGSGIFMNPHVVAKDARSSAAVFAAWLLGGAVALAGGFVWAELAARRPGVGGQYGYLRDGVGPATGFMYGWSNLLVTQTGGMAAVAVTFARYAHTLAAPPWGEPATAVAALALLTAVNVLGVRAGSAVQSAFMVAKIAAIAGLIGCGLWLSRTAAGRRRLSSPVRSRTAQRRCPVLCSWEPAASFFFTSASTRPACTRSGRVGSRRSTRRRRRS